MLPSASETPRQRLAKCVCSCIPVLHLLSNAGPAKQPIATVHLCEGLIMAWPSSPTPPPFRTPVLAQGTSVLRADASFEGTPQVGPRGCACHQGWFIDILPCAGLASFFSIYTPKAVASACQSGT